MIDAQVRTLLLRCFEQAAAKEGEGGSSYVVNRSAGTKVGLRWAAEYSATSVSPKALGRVRRYIDTQAEHHPGEGIPIESPGSSLGSAAELS